MVAPSGRWTTIEVPAIRQNRIEGGRFATTRLESANLERRARSAQPEDLVPGADPYIASLVQKLKVEILAEQVEREALSGSRRSPLDAIYEAVYDGVMGELVGGVYEELD